MLLGRERRSTTTYYDAAGNVTGSAVTVHDALFTDDDVDGVLERQAERAAQCPGCGQPRDEVWPEGPEDARRMEAEWTSQPMKCVACAARDQAKSRYETNTNPDTSGIHFVLQRRDG